MPDWVLLRTHPSVEATSGRAPEPARRSRRECTYYCIQVGTSRPKHARQPQSPAERPGNTVGTANERLRELILEGVYLPGQRLSQQELAERLQVGRTPLREALRLLEADGFVVSTANRGVAVAPAELGSAEELYAIRFLLEPPIVAALADEFTAEDLAEMEQHLHQMEASAERRRDFQRAHLDFHLVALRRYGEELSRLVLQLYRRVIWHQRVYMSRPRVPTDFVSVDRALLEALGSHRPEEVRAVLEFHLLDAALGVVLDVEPDHRFGPLLLAARGNGVEIDVVDGGFVRRPATLRRTARSSIPLETSNLRYEPESEKS
jgi:DNA-binding GntR family transcriptional regulator